MVVVVSVPRPYFSVPANMLILSMLERKKKRPEAVATGSIAGILMAAVGGTRAVPRLAELLLLDSKSVTSKRC